MTIASTGKISKKSGLIEYVKFRTVRPKYILRKYNLLITFAVLIIAASIISPDFFTSRNILNILQQNAILGMLAIGQTLVILTAGIDLSVGSTLSLSTLVYALTLLRNRSMLIASICGLGTGALVGLGNGLLTTKGKMPPIIVTLGTMGIVQGIASTLTHGAPVENNSYRFIAMASIGPVPVMVIIWLGFTILIHLLLKYRASFYHLYAVGGDEESARFSGISVTKIKIIAYIFSGLFASLGGLFYIARLFQGYSVAGQPYLLDSIAAVIIGGTSLFGGEGSVLGTLLGVIILGILTNLINLLNISIFAQDSIKGGIMLLIIAINIFQQRKK